jgi:hypothetical protein
MPLSNIDVLCSVVSRERIAQTDDFNSPELHLQNRSYRESPKLSAMLAKNIFALHFQSFAPKIDAQLVSSPLALQTTDGELKKSVHSFTSSLLH